MQKPVTGAQAPARMSSLVRLLTHRNCIGRDRVSDLCAPVEVPCPEHDIQQQASRHFDGVVGYADGEMAIWRGFAVAHA